MAPKRTASSSSATKRKAEAAEDNDGSAAEASQPSQTKKPKRPVKAAASAADAPDGGVAENGQPTNKVLPVNIAFAGKAPGAVRIASWNVSGLAAAQKKVRSAQFLPFCCLPICLITYAMPAGL